MAQLPDSKDVVEFKELLLANTIQIDTMYQLLIQKGHFTELEFLEKMKPVRGIMEGQERKKTDSALVYIGSVDITN